MLKISRNSAMTPIDKHIVIKMLHSSNNDKEHTDLSLHSYPMAIKASNGMSSIKVRAKALEFLPFSTGTI